MERTPSSAMLQLNTRIVPEIVDSDEYDFVLSWKLQDTKVNQCYLIRAIDGEVEDMSFHGYAPTTHYFGSYFLPMEWGHLYELEIRVPTPGKSTPDFRKPSPSGESEWTRAESARGYQEASTLIQKIRVDLRARGAR